MLEASPYLKRFKRLKVCVLCTYLNHSLMESQYVTCVATSTEESTLAEELEIAEKWHEECPTLKTIILPRGRVWFQKQASTPSQRNWECLDD